MDSKDIVLLVAVSGGAVFAVMAVIMGNAKHILQRKSVEKSRREIAAYVAEGSMSPEDGRTLLEADPLREPETEDE